MSSRNLGSLKIGLPLLILIIFAVICIEFQSTSLANNEEAYKNLKLFSDVIEELEKNYVDEVDAQKLIQDAVEGMVSSLDPHSSFMPPEAFEELQVDTKGEFGGIGIVITIKKDLITVIAPIEGTPAYKSGIKPGDIIVKVDGESTKDMKLWEAVKKMRGEKGTPVVITVYRKEATDYLDFKLVRDVIPIISVKYITLKSGYGYVWITNFREDTHKDLEKALEALEAEDSSLKGLIIDLRNNPGGLLSEAVKITDLFINKGTIVSIKGRKESDTKIFKAHSDNVRRKYPIVLLINSGSASASEIVAGALQDHHRALIMGTVSFGKGSVQTVKPLQDGYGIKYTVARYYTPNGRSIQAQGIQPDIFIKYEFLDQDINDDEEDEEDIFKESMLKNHLEAEPDLQKPLQKKSPQEDKIKKEHLSENRSTAGFLDVDKLLRDSQIKKALEVLISYDIFQNFSS